MGRRLQWDKALGKSVSCNGRHHQDAVGETPTAATGTVVLPEPEIRTP
ncbi:MAG: hypothetical protein ACLQVY_19035 [Limisphaerales bacterium]